MQTGIISFGDRVAWNIKCNNTKDIILNDIYNLYGIRIIQKHYYIILISGKGIIIRIPFSRYFSNFFIISLNYYHAINQFIRNR